MRKDFSMKLMRKLLNPLFIFHLVFIGAVLVGYVPRELVIYETALLAIYFLLAPIEDGIIFFVRSIPLWIAIPITTNFDNFNQWRIFAILLFIRWLSTRETWHYLGSGLILLYKKPSLFIREHSWTMLLKVLLFLSLISLWQAEDVVIGLKRIIFLINASLIAIVIAHPARPKAFIQRLIKNITVPVIIVTLVGVIQVASTYFIDIYQFMRIWGEGIQMREFGTTWSYIAVHLGNTWFAYFGDQLSLRVFSLFPDSHSFPIFLLLGLPAFFAWTLIKPIEKAEHFKAMLSTRGKLAVLWIPLIFLMMILSGTRGIWAGGIAMIIWSLMVLGFMKYQAVRKENRNIFAYLASYLVIFFLLFAVAYPIFSSPQFLVSKGDSLLLRQRFKSIVDFGETSNSQRIDIWKKSLTSIERKPVLGVGIGNFPVVLGQKTLLSKAGSSAHNIYLQVGAEMGILALVIFLWLLWAILKHIYITFARDNDPIHRAYFGGLLITLPWILVYLMTDVAIFDERALLLCVVTLAVTASHAKPHA